MTIALQRALFSGDTGLAYRIPGISDQSLMQKP